ncbi:MAG: hypothetical protein AAF183_18075 [Pseudomonadota bacterium]
MKPVPRETYDELLYAAQDAAHCVESHAQAAYEARRRTGPVKDADAAPWRRFMPRSFVHLLNVIEAHSEEKG